MTGEFRREVDYVIAVLEEFDEQEIVYSTYMPTVDYSAKELKNAVMVYADDVNRYGDMTVEIGREFFLYCVRLKYGIAELPTIMPYVSKPIPNDVHPISWNFWTTSSPLNKNHAIVCNKFIG